MHAGKRCGGRGGDRHGEGCALATCAAPLRCTRNEQGRGQRAQSDRATGTQIPLPLSQSPSLFPLFIFLTPPSPRLQILWTRGRSGGGTLEQGADLGEAATGAWRAASVGVGVDLALGLGYWLVGGLRNGLAGGLCFFFVFLIH